MRDSSDFSVCDISEAKILNKKNLLVALFIALIVVSLVFVGCDGHTHQFDSAWRSDETYHWKKCACGKTGEVQKHKLVQWVIDKDATATTDGLRHSTCEVCGKTISETIPKQDGSSRSVDFYAINDFHGEVDKISQFCGYLTQVSNGNTLLLNSGDMFQGSMESNSNYGKLLSDCLALAGFDELTFGNHEFDWGLDNLKKLVDESGVPFLGANIYNWNADSKTWGDFASDLAREYIVKTLDNGLKVGVIGVIGEKQITSISSNLVQTIGFKDPLPIIKTLSDKLKNELDCDIVVVSAHASPRGLVGESDDYSAPPSSSAGLYEYVDAVFCAHTHQEQLYVVDGIPFIQGGSNGDFVSHIRLSVESNGNVICREKENVRYSNSWPNKIDVSELVDNSNDKIKDEANQVLGNVAGGYLNSGTAIPRLVSRAIADYAVSQGYEISLAMVNSARSSLSGEITYSDLYNAIPFDNVVYVANVLGREILNEVKYGVSFWRVDGQAIESNKYYKIAVLDYLLYHQNEKREYNYFPSAFASSNAFKPVALTKEGVEAYNYRLITRDYLLAGSGYISIADYVYANDYTNPDYISYDLYLNFRAYGMEMLTFDISKQSCVLQSGKRRFAA